MHAAQQPLLARIGVDLRRALAVGLPENTYSVLGRSWNTYITLGTCGRSSSLGPRVNAGFRSVVGVGRMGHQQRVHPVMCEAEAGYARLAETRLSRLWPDRRRPGLVGAEDRMPPTPAATAHGAWILLPAGMRPHLDTACDGRRQLLDLDLRQHMHERL